MLKDGLQDIHHRFSQEFQDGNGQKPWPAEKYLRKLSYAIGGLPVLASAVLKFIGDTENGDPDSQLKVCLSLLESSRISWQPALEGPDVLYRNIMARIPTSLLSTAKLILSFCILVLLNSSSLNADLKIPARIVWTFLCLDGPTCHRALQKLHSVIQVPQPEEADHQPLRIYHKSFVDFLLDSSRSGVFGLDVEQARYNIVMLSIRWYSCRIRSQCEIQSKIIFYVVEK
jgi:hypothetical protein